VENVGVRSNSNTPKKILLKQRAVAPQKRYENFQISLDKGNTS
jgi:hypothetical protein